MLCLCAGCGLAKKTITAVLDFKVKEYSTQWNFQLEILSINLSSDRTGALNYSGIRLIKIQKHVRHRMLKFLQ